MRITYLSLLMLLSICLTRMPTEAADVSSNPEATDWVSPSKEGKDRGPCFVPGTAAVKEVQVREQPGYGIVDIRLGYRFNDKKDVEYIGWACNSEEGKVLTLKVPDDRILAGIDAIEQGGHGLVDIRLYLRNPDGTPLDEPVTPWVCGNDKYELRKGRTPAKQIVVGIEAREQAGYGVVNLKLRYVPIK
jgi:hypothetical protein